MVRSIAHTVFLLSSNHLRLSKEKGSGPPPESITVAGEEEPCVEGQTLPESVRVVPRLLGGGEDESSGRLSSGIFCFLPFLRGK